jgi:hypothetical protein
MARPQSYAFYYGRIDYATVEKILGREEAMRMKLLRASIDQSPAIPQLEDGLPSDDEFYNGEIPEWTGANPSVDDESNG